MAKFDEIGYLVCFSSFYVKTRESQYLGNSTSEHQNEKQRPLFNTKFHNIDKGRSQREKRDYVGKIPKLGGWV